MVKKHAGVILCVTVFLCLIYGQLRHHEFINFDDQDYVTDNPYIQKGLSRESFFWAFSLNENDLTYWHPLAYVAHMLDCHLFGMDSGAHHLSNLVLHGANVILLYTLLVTMTGAVGRSAFAACLFAVHPIGVDSVAWIAQKKTLLATVFWLLSLIAYIRYARKPGWGRYALVGLAVLAGLLSKPVMVTIPLVFLLVDVWPLNRWKALPRRSSEGCQPRGLTWLVLEKIPFVLFVILWGMTPFLADHVRAKNIPLDVIPLGLRLKHALVSCFVYLKQFVWPLDLTFLYPYPERVSTLSALAALVALGLISLGLIRLIGRFPYLAMGWFLFLIVLFPFLGLVQGAVWPAHADRFAYVPLIGIYLITAWGGYDLIRFFKVKPWVYLPLMAVWIGFFSLLTHHQTAYWKNNIRLYTHALEINDRNHLAYHNLGVALDEQGRGEDARKQYYLSLWAKPGFSKAHHNLAVNFLKHKETQKARDHFIAALASNPDNPVARYNLGSMAMERCQMDDAVLWYQSALADQPDFPEVHNNLGVIRLKQGQLVEAADHFKQAVRYRPDHLEALSNLGNTLFDLGQTEQALLCFSRVLAVSPHNLMALNDMGVVYAATGRTDQAEQVFRMILARKPSDPAALENLALIERQRPHIDESAPESAQEP